MKTILSLFDYSGRWSRPYRLAGYDTILVDVKHTPESERRILEGDGCTSDYDAGRLVCIGDDVRWVLRASLSRIHGILAAPPCTDFAVSGAQYWPAKDADGRTAASMAPVRAGFRVKMRHRRNAWRNRVRRWRRVP